MFLLMDRIVTATTLAALVQGLLGLREALREDPALQLPLDDEETVALWQALVDILQGTHKAIRTATQRDEALQAVLRLYSQLLLADNKGKSDNASALLYYKTWLTTPQPVVWIQAVVDVATSMTDNNAQAPRYASYTRVLCLQTIVQAAAAQP